MECYGGTSWIASLLAFIAGILIVLLSQWIYKKYYSLISKGLRLIHPRNNDHDDEENGMAFENAAFDGAEKKSILNTNWVTEKPNRKDKNRISSHNCTKTSPPRAVLLKGSDFTGLGIECHGSYKNGIFVKKVAPHGPASNLINVGDRIVSVLIDFEHIVQEDASTILSYASPYNIKLELVDGKGGHKLIEEASTSSSSTPLVHPLMRASSSTDVSTMERASSKGHFNLGNGTNHNSSADQMTSGMKDNEPTCSPSFLKNLKVRLQKLDEKLPKLHSRSAKNCTMSEMPMKEDSSMEKKECMSSNSVEPEKLCLDEVIVDKMTEVEEIMKTEDKKPVEMKPVDKTEEIMVESLEESMDNENNAIIEIKDELDKISRRYSHESEQCEKAEERIEDQEEIIEEIIDDSAIEDSSEKPTKSVNKTESAEAEIDQHTKRAASMSNLISQDEMSDDEDKDSLNRTRSLVFTESQPNGLASSVPETDLVFVSSATMEKDSVPLAASEKNFSSSENKNSGGVFIKWNAMNPFGSMERPKSDVLKKIFGENGMSEKNQDEDISTKKIPTKSEIVDFDDEQPQSFSCNEKGVINIPIASPTLDSKFHRGLQGSSATGTNVVTVSIDSQPIKLLSDEQNAECDEIITKQLSPAEELHIDIPCEDHKTVSEIASAPEGFQSFSSPNGIINLKVNMMPQLEFVPQSPVTIDPNPSGNASDDQSPPETPPSRVPLSRKSSASSEINQAVSSNPSSMRRTNFSKIPVFSKSPMNKTGTKNLLSSSPPTNQQKNID